MRALQGGVKIMIKKSASVLFLSIIVLLFNFPLQAVTTKERGIYINQGTAENTSKLSELIRQSKAVGINTFVIDMQRGNKTYQKNVQMVKNSGIKYVARVVVFADGGYSHQVKSPTHWQNKLNLVKMAESYGANEIQLDYIRYSSKVRPSPQNAQDVKQVIAWFKQRTNVPLQIDIFGEVSFKESPRIGQNIKLFADTIDAACPMVYPSHYHPYQEHSAQPYKTVYKSLQALKGQFPNNRPPFKLIPFIESSNYHYRWSQGKRADYVLAQIKAAEDANADGWYVWSPQNIYSSLFQALQSRVAK